MEGKSAIEVFPGVHLIASLLERLHTGCHQGAPNRKHLQAYLDEFVFRLNRRSSTHPSKGFSRLLQAAASVQVRPYWRLVA